jgi:hypothetical protein
VQAWRQHHQQHQEHKGAAMTSEGIDLPVLVEGIEEFYRNVYACPLLGPIFRGINMVVLRKHVSYFLHSITMWDTPMSPHQVGVAAARVGLQRTLVQVPVG